MTVQVRRSIAQEGALVLKGNISYIIGNEYMHLCLLFIYSIFLLRAYQLASIFNRTLPRQVFKHRLLLLITILPHEQRLLIYK